MVRQNIFDTIVVCLSGLFNHSMEIVDETEISKIFH